MDELFYPGHTQGRGMANIPMYRHINALFGCIDSDTDSSENHVRRLLQGMKEVSTESGDVRMAARIRPIRRVEIFCDDHTAGAQHLLQDRGLVMFDDTDEPVVHVLNALLGYSGSGPSLTQAILRELSIPDQIFIDIQHDLWDIRSTDTPYYVIIQSAEREDGRLEWHWSSVDAPVHR
jgi:hypothetical protein